VVLVLLVLMVVIPVPMQLIVPSVLMDISFPPTMVAKLAQLTVLPVLKEKPLLPQPVPSVPLLIT
jgi:hypothetical protein